MMDKADPSEGASSPKDTIQRPYSSGSRHYSDDEPAGLRAQGDRGGGLPRKAPRDRAIARMLYIESARTADEVAELLEIPKGTITRWWRVIDSEEFGGQKPPHRGGRGQAPEDVTASLKAEVEDLRARLVEANARAARAGELTSEADLILSEAKVALRSSIATASSRDAPGCVRAAIDLHRYMRERGGTDEAEERAEALRESLRAIARTMPRPTPRPGTIDLGETPRADPVDPIQDAPKEESGAPVEDDGAPF